MGCFLGLGKDCNKSSEADLLLAQAALEKSKQKQVVDEWTPLEIIGVVGGSLLALTLMAVIILKVKKSKG
jgi:hypothetical protein